MRRLLALGVDGSWEGQWHTPQGNERAIVAAPIGEGEEVRLEVESIHGLSPVMILLSAEPTLIQVEDWVRFRIVKDGSRAIERRATSVEIILNVSRREVSGPRNTERSSSK